MQSRMNLVLIALAALAVLVGAATTAVADIIPVGDVTPAQPWDSTTFGYVGNTDTVGPNTLTVNGDSDLISKTAYIGNDAGVTGTATVTGSGSTWNNSGGSYSFYVGFSGIGVLNIYDGGTSTNTGHIMVARYAGSSGTISIDGSGSKLTGRTCYIGASGDATLEITDGGVLENSSSFYLANSSGSTATATVDGSGSMLNVPSGSVFAVGKSGSGTLEIKNGGAVTNAPAGSIGYSSSSSGVVTVTGAGSIWTNTAGLTVGKASAGTLNLNSGGTLSTNTLTGGTGLATVNFNGGVLKPYNADATWSTLGTNADSHAYIKEGGAIFDTAGYDMGIAVVLQEKGDSPGGGLTKKGAGKLTLSGANTYTGDTIVDEGTLSLAYAYLDDASAVEIDFGAVLDLTHGLTDTIESLYFNGYQQSAGLYGTGNSGGYISGTGSLLVTIPEPGALVLLATGLLGLLAYAWRKRK